MSFRITGDERGKTVREKVRNSCDLFLIPPEVFVDVLHCRLKTVLLKQII